MLQATTFGFVGRVCATAGHLPGVRLPDSRQERRLLVLGERVEGAPDRAEDSIAEAFEALEHLALKAFDLGQSLLSRGRVGEECERIDGHDEGLVQELLQSHRDLHRRGHPFEVHLDRAARDARDIRESPEGHLLFSASTFCRTLTIRRVSSRRATKSKHNPRSPCGRDRKTPVFARPRLVSSRTRSRFIGHSSCGLLYKFHARGLPRRFLIDKRRTLYRGPGLRPRRWRGNCSTTA